MNKNTNQPKKGRKAQKRQEQERETLMVLDSLLERLAAWSVDDSEKIVDAEMIKKLVIRW